MPALPETRSRTAIAVDAAQEADQKPRHGYRLAAGGVNAPCDRQIWLSFRWATAPEVFTAKTLRIFETGREYERRVMRWLAQGGLSIVEYEGVKDDGTPKQIGVSFAQGHGYGFLDGEATNVPDAPAVVHVVEVKSHNAKSWAALKARGVEASKPEHYGQFQMYMHRRGLNRAVYAAVCKDSDEFDTWRIEYDLEFCTRLELRAERIAFADHPPARVSEDPTRYPCTFCRQAPICHRQAWPETNCRTCLFITATKGGGWLCERLQVELTREEQELGCGSHLYLPSLVPGEQIDAAPDGSWVDYRLNDGTIFRNQPTTEGEAHVE